MADRTRCLAGHVVLITGAARGLGRVSALAAARAGATVIATARAESLEGLESLRGEVPGIEAAVLDVRQESQCFAVISDCIARHGRLDALVNNAAVTYRALIADAEHEDIDEQLSTNFLGPLHLIRAVLPHMKARGAGRIVNVSSVAGMMAMPTMGMYSATKFAIEGLSESLWYEARFHGIHVSLVEPGFTRNGALEHIRYCRRARDLIANATDGKSFYQVFDEFVAEQYRRFGSEEHEVVAAVMRALTDRHPALRYPATRDATFFYWLRRLLPRRFYHWLLYRELPRSGHGPLRTAPTPAAPPAAGQLPPEHPQDG